MAGIRIKYKLNYRQLEALAMLHIKLADVLKPTPAQHHEILLCAHLHTFIGQLHELLRKEQNSYTWAMDDVSSLAFCQLWDLVDAEINGTEYEALQLQEIKNTIDKHRKNKLPRDYYERIKAYYNSQASGATPQQQTTGQAAETTENGAGFGMGY